MVNFLDKRLRPSDWAKIQPCPMSGCWLWCGSTLESGYGSVGIVGRGDRSQLAHRYVYSTLVGPIGDGLVLDHKCRQRCCVNPLHLDPVTRQENNRRAGAVRAAARTHCRNGHPATPENTITRMHHGKPARWCRICDAARKAEWRAAQESIGRGKLRPLTPMEMLELDALFASVDDSDIFAEAG